MLEPINHLLYTLTAESVSLVITHKTLIKVVTSFFHSLQGMEFNFEYNPDFYIMFSNLEDQLLEETRYILPKKFNTDLMQASCAI